MAVLSEDQRSIAPPLLEKAARLWERRDFSASGYALLPILLAIRYVNAPPDMRTYGPSHWFLNYDHGFVRRALVGQAFAHFSYFSWHAVFLAEAAFLLCVVMLSYLVFRSILFGHTAERRLAAFLLAAPAFLPHMASMAGELDNFLYIALLIAAGSLMRLSNNFGLFIATIFSCVGLLMHEGFLLLFYPLILVLLVELLHRGCLKRWAVGVHLAAVGICFVGILVMSRRFGVDADWVAQAQQHTDMPIESVVYIALHNSLAEQVHFALGLYSRQLVERVLVCLVLSIPYGIALWRLLQAAVRRRGYSPALARIVVVSFFLPLLLLPLGHDAMRWTSALCINISLYVLFLYQSDQRASEDPTPMQLALCRWTATASSTATFLYLLALGPWGLTGNSLFTNLNRVLMR